MATEFRSTTLSNGLTIIAEPDPAAHTAAIGIYVKTGARDEASPQMGVSHFLEHMMFKGTEKRTADQVNQEFDDIGASHNAFTSHEMTAFWAHMLPEHMDKAEDILTDIMRPSLRQEDFDAEKGVILEEIAMYEDHPFWVLYEMVLEKYYPVHPLRHRVLGTKESIEAMQRDEMAAYFDDRYAADNTVVCLAGQVEFDARVAAIELRCGEWKRSGTSRAYPELERSTTEFTHSTEAVNRHYMLMLAPGPSIQNDDRYAAAMLGTVLGDVDGSRLYWSLIETGLADEAQAQYDGRDGTGELFIYASCSPDRAEDVEQVIRTEIKTFVGSVTEDDLERVRSKVATAATLAGERPAGRMRRLGHLWTYTGEYRPLEEEVERINNVTLDELKHMAEQYPWSPHIVGHLTPA